DERHEQQRDQLAQADEAHQQGVVTEQEHLVRDGDEREVRPDGRHPGRGEHEAEVARRAQRSQVDAEPSLTHRAAWCTCTASVVESIPRRLRSRIMNNSSVVRGCWTRATRT